MVAESDKTENLKQVVPFLLVTDMERSVRFYTDGLGFVMKNQWMPDGKLRWCWLTRGGASLMLQEFAKSGPDAPKPEDKLGQGVSLAFQCEDAVALYHEFRSRGIEAKEPFVGNSMWVTILSDPDGYKLDFESPTDVPEETKLSEVEASRKA
jgi:catechol 2,3-dioxygenase-like lactoylglutathione lyase family enzyme